jgi:hypothetical protein
MRFLTFLNTTRSKVAATFLATLTLCAALIFVTHYEAMRTISSSKSSGLARMEANHDIYGLYQYGRSRAASSRTNVSLEGFAPEGKSLADTRMIVMRSEAVYLIKDTDKVLDESRKLVQQLGGYVATLERNNNGSDGALLELRIPAGRFDDARAGLAALSMNKQSEKLDTEDVTKAFVDTESQIRNLKAQEAQYLQIMKSASKVTDVLAVTEKLEEVRGQIETLQGENNYRKHHSELATLKVAFVTETPMQIAGVTWKPELNARLAWQETKRGLIHWADAAVSMLLYIPVLSVWILSIAAFFFGGWKILILLKSFIDRFFPQSIPAPEQAG